MMAEGQPGKSVVSDTNQAKRQQLIFRADYRAPDFLIQRTDLVFELDEQCTRVSNTLQVLRNPQGSGTATSLELQGEELKLLGVTLDGERQDASRYQVSDKTLVLHNVPDAFELRIETEINPSKNLALEGLYLSDGIFCTQCEAEGFRRITYYLDRPDVMSVFSTRIIADKQRYPVLLSNGNRLDSGDLDDGRHWVHWQDPFKKPCYLFALVAGQLAVLEDSFETMSGREVKLRIYAERKDIDKCQHAMRALQNAMRWDEQVYGREYDLDLYMIVAVDFFNMGAMENKGLNVFNTSCVLAHQATQTDAAFQRVEAVIAHEYFHNWSGNRVTCRDWFQLSLKEGFTVFRDACFSADMNSETVKRIEDVNLLRSAQFAEDAGPLAHPVRPDSFIEISNFYTLTIYEKGAEVIRMMHRLLGPEAFRKGSDLYFSRHDGQAVTCEDFVLAMEEASGIDLRQFRRWYEQAGTPEITVEDDWDEQQGRYSLEFSQNCPATPGQPEKQPFTVPVDAALLMTQGEQPAALQQHMLVLDQPRQRFEFTGLDRRPVPSLLRGFSAPVKLNYRYSNEQLLSLVEHESDGFVRWDATRRLLLSALETGMQSTAGDNAGDLSRAIAPLVGAMRRILVAGFDGNGTWQPGADAALLAEMLSMLNYDYVVGQLDAVDPLSLVVAMELLEAGYAKSLGNSLDISYQNLNRQLQEIGVYRPAAADIALRSLKNTCLHLMLQQPDEGRVALATEQFRAASNMTDQFGALQAMVFAGGDIAQSAAQDSLDRFYQQWQNESLVINQWLSVQAAANRADTLECVRDLQQHPAYDPTNPNKVRALVAAFCLRSPRAFHREDGSGYQLLVEEVLRLNKLNPQLAARLITPLARWRSFAPARQSRMRDALAEIHSSSGLSSDVYEVVTKSLA